MPENQTLSVYLPKELWDKVKEAEASRPGFKATEFCKRQLANVIALETLPDDGGTESGGEALSPVELYDYSISVQPTQTSAEAYINDVVVPQGAYPVSVSVNLAGQYVITIAWPKTE
jgi:hypothetical protein